MADFYISPGTRAKYRPSADALNISMDFNASPNGGARGTEVVIPNNASPSVRAAAERYNQLVTGFANKYGITDYPVRGVRTRAENKRGVAHTIHAEPFFNDDEAMQRAVQANPAEFAELYRSAFGGLDNARLIAPHGVGKDRGASSAFFGDETSYGELMANSLLGQAPQATASTQGAAPMMQQEEKPRGLLGGLGIQKMQEGAPGETGQRFYERDSFKDTAAVLAQGFGRMGIMGMEEIADNIAKQRTESKAKNKTVEMLRKMPNGEELVRLAEIAGPAAVAQQVLAQQFKGAEKVTPSSAIGKLQSDLASGLIDKEQYEVALANMAPKGMRIVSDGRGGFTMEQGVGVGDDGRMAPSDPSFMLKAIDDILADPALDTSTGIMSPLQNVPGTPQYRFGTRARQLQGQAFLQAFESLKGGGQITEIEGQKAEAAIGRLDTAQGPKDYRDALAELRSVLAEAQKRARQPSSAPSGVIEYDATGKRIIR